MQGPTLPLGAPMTYLSSLGLPLAWMGSASVPFRVIFPLLESEFLILPLLRLKISSMAPP